MKSLYINDTFSKKHSLSALLIMHFKTKCLSSSISSHIRHFLSATGVFGLVCRPLSISNACELHSNLQLNGDIEFFLLDTDMVPSNIRI